MPNPKILITDGLFPNRYASWRNVEILSFMKKYDTSILVKHGKSWAGIQFEVDFRHNMYESLFEGSEYKILIFDQEYNYLNDFNPDFDGCAFNKEKSFYSYCITKHSDFEIDDFQLVYHIFLGCYYDFNQNFDFPQESQIIHLYPGGGFAPGQAGQVSNNTNVIVTHPLVEREIQETGISYLSSYTAPLYMSEEKPEIQRKQESHLNICFSSLGGNKEKGADTYWLMAIVYRLRYPKTKVRFHSIGNCRKNIFIKKHPPMSFIELEKFYAKNIDIYLNLANSLAFNGWPLGLEAAKNGSALLTTDPDRVATYYQSEKYEIHPLRTLHEFMREIRKCEKNSAHLENLKRSHKAFAERFAGYENQQKRIFEFVDSRPQRNKS